MASDSSFDVEYVEVFEVMRDAGCCLFLLEGKFGVGVIVFVCSISGQVVALNSEW